MIKKPNTFILTSIIVLVVIQVVFLRPSRIETVEEDPQNMANSIETQLLVQKQNDEIKYTLEGLHYTSIEGGKKQWEMVAKEAMVYNKSSIISSDDVTIKMFDPLEKMTLIDSDRAYFRMGEKELQLEGHIKVTFPDGFWVKTEKASYASSDQRISSKEPFYGESVTSQNELLKIWGTGFTGSKTGSQIEILKESRVQMKRLEKEEYTDVRSDHAQIDRFTKFAEFFMQDKDRFVDSNQGTLHVRSKKQQATYDSSNKVVKYLTALEDVLIRETDSKKSSEGMKYATCQKAEFYTKENKILLSGFPSVYQDKDTVTGELITIFRNSNIIEVTEANAYHEGEHQTR